MTGAEASALSQWLLLLGTTKQIGLAGFGLYSFSLLLLMLSLEMTKMMAIKACYAGGVIALTSVFFLAFDSILLMAFSALPLLFLLFFLFSFFYVLLSFSVLFFCSSVRSLEGLIYSLNMYLFRKDSMH